MGRMTPALRIRSDDEFELPKRRTWRQWWVVVVKWELAIAAVEVLIWIVLRWLLL